jgi:putative tryptophan/tyrosine transport system substrate-binding protein
MIPRREFLTLLGGATAAAWPLAARAQAAMPLVGFLVSGSEAGYADAIAEVRRGLADTGRVEGRNLKIEYRYGDNDYDRLPLLADDLVTREPSVIFSTGSVNSVLAAKAATTRIPIVFANGSDPVKFGVVTSMNRPGGNVTGVSFYNNALIAKRLELLRELLPTARRVGFMANPANPNANLDREEARAAAESLNVSILTVGAAREHDLDAAVAAIAEARSDVMLVNTDTLFQSQAPRIAGLAVRHKLPAMSSSRRQAAQGYLITYGTNAFEMYRQAGVYVGRILRGDQPGDLPVLQPTKFELVINLQTAKALGLEVPPTLLARADEVIER